MKRDTILTASNTAETEYVSVPRAEYETLRADYEILKSENAELNQKLDFLMGQLRLAKKKVFGASSEQAGE